MIKVETFATVERAILYTTWKFSTQLQTSNSIENKPGRNAFIYHTKQTDYIL